MTIWCAIVHHIGMKARRKGSLSYFILTALEKAVDGYVRMDDFINNSGLYAYHGGWEYPLKKSDLAKAIKRLRDSGIVEEVKLSKDIILRLTTSGEELVGQEPKAWDGKWRIVIFDIPDQKRIIRNLFRRNLKKWGFKHLQKSVWISKRNIFDKLSSYIKDLGLEKWVVVIEADRLTDNTIS